VNNGEMPSKMPRMIYIMGTARSGSTILEILLGKGKGVFGAGELTHLIEDGFIKDADCSCNHPVSECMVWSSVKEELSQNNGCMQNLAKLQKKVEWHIGFARQLFGRFKSNEIEEYTEFNRRLLISIQKVSGCQVVVDSSKYPGRALALRRLVKADVRIICLTRSPEGLMSSFQKNNKDEQRPKTPLKVLVYYVATLATLRVATWMLRGHVLEIRYEGLLADPIASLVKMEFFSELDLSETKRHIEEDTSILVGHIVTGNRLRKNTSIKFNSSNEHILQSNIGPKLVIFIMNIWRCLLRF
jgi:hypothetical protein